jgi:Pro-kumamolisin, activation domain/Subtilase family
MRRNRPWLAVLCLLAVLGAAPGAGAATPGAVRIGAAPVLPAGASLDGALAPERPLSLYVALEPRDPAGLESFASEVSTPGSPAYGQYLSVPEFAARFGATAAQVATVRTALLARGLQVGEPSANDLSLPISATAAEAEAAFGVALERVSTADGRVAYANLSAPQVPAAAAPYVAGVIGLDDLDVPQRAPVTHATAAAEAPAAPLPAASASVLTGGPQPCAAALSTQTHEGGYTADQIASAYDFSGFYGAGDFGAGQTIALLELEPFLPADIALYQGCYGTHATVETVNLEGGPEPYEKGDGGEAELDIEQLIGLAPAAKILVYQGPNQASIPILSTFVAQNAAKVMSSSWGLCEKFTGKAEMTAFDTLLQEAAAQGQSFFVASGDSGSTDCYQREGVHDKSIQVDFPGTDPFATSVGGTQMEAPTSPPLQYIWNDRLPEGAGGGGVSTRFAMPGYQQAASSALNVIGPLSSGTPCAQAGYCREVPDVSADAAPRTGYIVRAEEAWEVIGGTSAAAPLWAAFATLTNASPACAGQAIGFANPALYALAGVAYAGNFDDVTTSSPGLPRTTNLFSEASPYAAGPLYDMATGLGTPVGAALGASLCGVAQTAEAPPSPPAIPSTPTSTPTTTEPPASPPAPTPQPHVSGGHLVGVGKGRPRLTLALEARGGAALTTVSIALPIGLVPTPRAKDLAVGIVVRDGAGHRLKVSAATYARQSIRLRLTSPTAAVTLTLRPPALAVTPKLIEHVRSGRTHKLGLIVTTAETGGTNARFPLSLSL